MLTKLKMEIEKSGLKQSHIAHVLSIDSTLLSHFVRGERTPTEDVLKRISKLLKVAVDSLRGIVE